MESVGLNNLKKGVHFSESTGIIVAITVQESDFSACDTPFVIIPRRFVPFEHFEFETGFSYAFADCSDVDTFESLFCVESFATMAMSSRNYAHCSAFNGWS